MSFKVESVTRIDAYSVGEYGETIRVYRMVAGGPFYYEANDKRRLVRQNGKRIWNPKDAKQWARDRHRDYRSSCEPTLAAIFGLYLEHRSPVKATAQGRKDDQRRAEMWKRVLGAGRDPLSIGRGDIDSFIQKRGCQMIDAWGRANTGGATANAVATPKNVRPRTVHADLQWLRGVLRWSLQDRCPVSAQDIAMRKIARELHQSAEPRRPVATQDRYEAIMAYLEGENDYAYLRDILMLVNGTGHRLSEILVLRWTDCLLGAGPYGAIRWRAENNKARLDRVVPITLAVRQTLDAIQRERPGIGEAWLFPGLRDPRHPTHRSVADKWLRQAEREAGLPPQPGSLWHAYRRKWATERKHLPLADVAEAGGWKNARTLQTVYQQADPAGVLRVVLDATELREEKA